MKSFYAAARAAVVASGFAVTAGAAPTPPMLPSETSEPEIVVTAPQLRGAVKGDIPPEIELGETAVASYGASTISELLTALSTETTSGRGRGAGAPVVLLNGRRIAGFAEIRELPTEAIERVQIMPEEVALKFGYSADQRIVNFILQDNFRQTTVEGKEAASTEGARFETTGEGSFVKLGKQGRTSFSTSYTHDTPVHENERGIVEPFQTVPTSLAGNIVGLPSGSEIDPALSALAGKPVTVAAIPANGSGTLANFVPTANQPASTDLGGYRTLLAASDDFKLNGLVNRALSKSVSVTLNATYELALNRSLLGLPGSLLTVQPGAGSPFSTTVGVSRAFTPPLTRDARTDTLHGAVTFDGDLAQWQWTVTGTLDRTLVNTRTDAGIDTAGLQAQVTSGSLNAFGPITPLELPRNTARSQTDAGEIIATASGPLFELPAGSVRTTLRAGGVDTINRASAVQRGVATAANNSRAEGNARVNFDVPLTSRKNDILAGLGNITLNGNFGYRRLSDFGALLSYGYGVNWSPIDGMTLLASAIDSNNEPSVQQLASPVLTTPNVPVFDFTRGENAIVTTLGGGNPQLLSERRRDLKFGFTYKPPKLAILTVSINYFRNHSSNPTAAFPTLTPAVEAAFPNRVVRDAAGRLVSIDTRPVNFDETRSDVVRVGFNLSREFGVPPGRGTGGGFAGRGGAAGGRGGGFNRDAGRWNIALYDSVRIRDQVIIAPGQPVLDLLNGGAIGSNGGAPRHSVDLEGGWFNKGIGFRLVGAYSTGSMVTGHSGPSSTLQFSGLATLNAQAFVNFDSRPNIVRAVPFLKAARLRFAVTNITGAIRAVRDGTGVTPISYQPGYLDPRGRVVEIGLRKRF